MTGRSLGAPRRTQLDALRRASTRSHIYNVLRSEIVALEVLPGQALSENELADRLSVSRTPIREAIIRLADEGLVEVVPQLGTFVSRISVRDVLEVQFIRETLECASLPQAIQRISDDDERSLRRLLDEQAEAGRSGDLQHWFATDEDFHHSLLEIGGHHKIWPIVASTKAHLDRVRLLTLPDPELLGELHRQHREILDNIVAKQRRKAHDVLRRHLRLAIDLLQPLEEKHPDYFLLDDQSVDESASSTQRPSRARTSPRR